MSERDQAYRHQTEVPGTADEATAETEHRDTARGDASERNELTPAERNEPVQERSGPTTHDDTHIDRSPPHRG